MSDVTFTSPTERNTSNRAHSMIAHVTTLPYRFSQLLNQAVSPTKDSLTRPSEHHRKYYKKPNPQDQVMISYKEMWCRVVLMSGLILAMYNWCVWFTTLYPDVENTKYAFLYVMIFFVVTGLSSLLVRTSAHLVDR